MIDPGQLDSHATARLRLMRAIGVLTPMAFGTFAVLFRVGSGRWPLAGDIGGGPDMPLEALAILGGVAVALAWMMRAPIRARLIVAASAVALVAVLAFVQWIGAGLVVQLMWVLGAVAAGLSVLGAYAARILWYARRPKAWASRVAARQRRRVERAAPVTNVEQLDPPVRAMAKPREEKVIEVDLDDIDLGDEDDEPESSEPAGAAKTS
ncbi:hypothetical protein AB0F93_03635 [Micromonospora tulbaghiae]|uniref:hypothetical protein n=1 Tax=Micromonospora tulbaghiae TaxID=479978 RepID=UPI0033172AC5